MKINPSLNAIRRLKKGETVVIIFPDCEMLIEVLSKVKMKVKMKDSGIEPKIMHDGEYGYGG